MNNYLTFGLGAMFIGGMLGFFGMREKWVADTASATPEEITLRALIARGSEGNPNIILTDFALGQNYVYKHKNNIWESGWVPAVPVEDVPQGKMDPGKIQAVKAVIFSINARSEADLYNRCGQPKLKALVVNNLTSLGTAEKNLLRQSYPHSDIDNCLIIQEGRNPAGTLFLVCFLGGGAALMAGGFGAAIFGFLKWRQDKAEEVE